MKDRVPRYPGRVKLVPVAGQENTYDLVRADEAAEPGTAINKENLLKDRTAEALGLTGDAVPDEALMALAIGVSKYGYAIHVSIPGGYPAAGAAISNLTDLHGGPVVTDGNGDAFGISPSASVSVLVTSPFLDFADKAAKLTATGKITEATVELSQKPTNEVLITASQTAYFSPMVKTFDICAVGGGGGGGGGGGYNYYTYPGGGGGGGYVTNLLGISTIDTFEPLQITVGAGGSRGRNTNNGTIVGGTGGTGGATTVVYGVKTVTASGGTGGNGGGSSGASGGSGGSGNGSGGRGDNEQGKNGSSGTGYKFGDSTLGAAGGGGGGGGTFSGIEEDRASGGKPNGGDGGLNNSAATRGTTPGGGGGGAGSAGTASEQSAASGSPGGVFIRWHYF